MQYFEPFSINFEPERPKLSNDNGFIGNVVAPTYVT